MNKVYVDIMKKHANDTIIELKNIKRDIFNDILYRNKG